MKKLLVLSPVALCLAGCKDKKEAENEVGQIVADQQATNAPFVGKWNIIAHSTESQPVFDDFIIFSEDLKFTEYGGMSDKYIQVDNPYPIKYGETINGYKALFFQLSQTPTIPMYLYIGAGRKLYRYDTPETGYRIYERDNND